MELADRVVVMSNGRIEQVGKPEEVYHEPANAFVYDFLGNFNAFDGWRSKDGECHILPKGEKLPQGSEPIQLFARPHDMDVALEPQDDQAIAARIFHINPAGPLVSVEMENEHSTLLQAALTKEQFTDLDLKKGQTVYLKARELRIFQ